MNVTDTHPIRYLTPTNPSFWRWESGLIVFESGETLTFREELFAVIDHLQPFGLPPVETLLLFLAATREEFSWPACWQAYKENEAELEQALPSGWKERVQGELEKIRRLDLIWRKDLQRKCLLVEVCFEHSEAWLSPDAAQGVADLLELGFVPPEASLAMEPRGSVQRLARGLRPLLEGLPLLEERRLERRLRTGLEMEVGAFAKEDLSLGTTVRNLLEDLSSDPEWSGLARLARQLMAAVHVPRALGDPDDLPLGGFSDLSNRGNLDRLLVSELAQDDLVLSARLALNEALYLRRESPPKNPQESRLLLVDNGIRLWGMPRLFAVAVALAMEGKTNAQMKVEAFCPTSHQQLEEVKLHTREGLLAALSHLHTHAHPGNALLDLAKRSKTAGQVCEMVVVTHADVLEDASFASVSELIDQTFYLATVDRQGNYAFYQCAKQQRRVLQRARLDLDTLLSDPKEAARLKRPQVPVDLPEIFHRRPFPIRLPSHGLRDRTVFTRELGIFKSSRDGRLLHFDDPQKGGIQIADNLPEGRALPVVEVQGLADGRHVVAFLRKKVLEVCFVDLGSGAWSSVDIGGETGALQVVLIHQQLLVVYSSKVVLHEIRHGSALAELSLAKPVSRCYGDLLLLGSEWFRLGVDGGRPRLEATSNERVLESASMEEYQHLKMGGLRKHFRGISMGADGIVLHKSRSNEALRLKLSPVDLPKLVPFEGKAAPVLFTEVPAPEGARVKLKEACWPDGSRVILDSRGLLHFVSGDSDAPQITLILTGSGPLAAWSPTLGALGSDYYFETAGSSHAGPFSLALMRFRPLMAL